MKKLLADHAESGPEAIQKDKEAYKILEEEVVELKKQSIDADL